MRIGWSASAGLSMPANLLLDEQGLVGIAESGDQAQLGASLEDQLDRISYRGRIGETRPPSHIGVRIGILLGFCVVGLMLTFYARSGLLPGGGKSHFT